MFTFTKQDSIVIAVTLALALGVPLAVPAFYTSSNITVLDRATPPLPNDTLDGGLAILKDIGGDDVDSQWHGPGLDCGAYHRLPI